MSTIISLYRHIQQIIINVAIKMYSKTVYIWVKYKKRKGRLPSKPPEVKLVGAVLVVIHTLTIFSIVDPRDGRDGIKEAWLVL